jgi:hypothetical protein
MTEEEIDNFEDYDQRAEATWPTACWSILPLGVC